MRAGRAEVSQKLGVSAAALFERVSKDGEADGVKRAGRESSLLVDGGSEPPHGAIVPGEPAGDDVDLTKRQRPDDVAPQSRLSGFLGGEEGIERRVVRCIVIASVLVEDGLVECCNPGLPRDRTGDYRHIEGVS